jgi:hypothetical protein
MAREPYREYLRRSGQGPGPRLVPRYYDLTSRSLRDDIGKGLDEEGRIVAETVAGIRADNVASGLKKKDEPVAEDGPTVERGTVSPDQAVQEVVVGSTTFSYAVQECATNLRAELSESWISGGAEVDEVNAIWLPYRAIIIAGADEFRALTGLDYSNNELAVRLLKNAYTALGSNLANDLSNGLSQAEVARLSPTLNLGVKASKKPAAKEPEVAAKARDLFTSLTGLRAPLNPREYGRIQASYKAVGDKLQANLGEEFNEYYQKTYGVAPLHHATLIAKSLASSKPLDSSKTAAPDPFASFGIPAADVEAFQESESLEFNAELVDVDFDEAKAKSIAADMWRSLHSGDLHLLQKLYAERLPEEQKIIDVAFRQLSGGLDWKFYVQQAKVAKGEVRTGLAGSDDGQRIASGNRVRLSSDDSDLETALSLAETGKVNHVIRMEAAVANKHIDEMFRIADEADQESRDAILADDALLAAIQACCDDLAWERIFKALNGQADLADLLKSRTGGKRGFWNMFDRTDEEGMRADIRAYIGRRRQFHRKALREENRKLSPDKRVPENLLQQAAEARVKDECRQLMANPDVKAIIESEMQGYDLAQTQSVLLGAGEESAVAHVLRDGDMSVPESEIIQSIRNMSPDERKRLSQDTRYLERLADLLTDPAEYRDAMNALYSEHTGDGPDRLAELDKYSRSSREIGIAKRARYSSS